ncbi:MAG TPA: ATP-binding protein, partial [Candidatus Polarisedimenticolia bacterium]|nr:ATP-binding protein [Candidatus Polarisedimenticolia bacterium]
RDGVQQAHRRLALAELERLTGRKAGRIPTSYARIDAAGGEPALRADEIRSLAHVPLFIRGQVMGLLTVATRKPDAYGEAAMRLLYTIANQASLTLDRLHTAREAESSRIHSMLESMADGVMLLDLDLRLVMSNPAARSYLGALTGGRPGKVLRQLGELELRPLLESFAQPEARARTFEAAASSPESRIFSITCSPVRGLDAGVQGMVVVLSDITEARHLQMQLAQSEKLSAIGEMISGVAHELNNPLASVMGFAQLLQGAQVGEEVHAKLRAIDHEATRCRQVVQNLLRFARRHTPERRLLNINEVVDSVLQLLGHQLRVDDIHVELDLQADLPMVNGDFHLLQQVVLNVIHNAHQAMKDSRSASGGERAGRLAVASRARGDFVLVEIADNGPGIARENLKRIFDPFFSTKEVGKGTGLGLSLAYGTVREHGGGISAKSQPGEGSIFLIELPAAPAALQAGDRPVLAEAAAVPEPEAAAAASPAHRASRRILIVEDEAPLAEVVCEVLQSMGHQVDTVGDGRIARTRIEQHPYDLIISDLKMPNMSGRELYRHVAATSPELARRIIFSTGDTANPDTRAFFEETGNPFLAKPFNLKDLIHLVDSVLEAT